VRAGRNLFFRRTYIFYVAVFILALLFSEVYVTSVIRESHIENLRENMLKQGRLIAGAVDLGDAGDLDALCRAFKESVNTRVSLILPDGRVVGDSDVPHDKLENHADRPELQQAWLDGQGSSVRYSRTLGHDLMYTALRIGESDKPSGYVRLAVPLMKVQHDVNVLRLRIFLAVGLVLLLTSAISIVQTVRIRNLVGQVTDFSDYLADGVLDKRLMLEGVGEFDVIAGNLNSMAERLDRMVAENKEEKERLAVILRSVPDALLILDAENSIVMASAATREFFHSGEALTDRPVGEIIRSPEFFSLLDSVRHTGDARDAELMIEHPVPRDLIAKVSPLMHQGKAMSGLIVLFHDITGMKQLDKVRKDFVANVSHELKTPIAAIKGFADTLMEGAIEDSENARRFLEIIKSNSERINTLVDDLMTISKIEMGVIRVEKAEVDVKEVMEQAVALLDEKARGKGLLLNVEIPENIQTIEADRDRLIQILTNLLDNAIKFTEKGNVTLGLGGEPEEHYIFVRDTGIGIPSKHLPRIGERFYRVDPSRSRELGGTGLGLAIVKHLVKAHGWEMKVESAERKGTEVFIRGL
jgi:two-component system phosphate regulon sensor histidine kinase PhoR